MGSWCKQTRFSSAQGSSSKVAPSFSFPLAQGSQSWKTGRWTTMPLSKNKMVVALFPYSGFSAIKCVPRVVLEVQNELNPKFCTLTKPTLRRSCKYVSTGRQPEIQALHTSLTVAVEVFVLASFTRNSHTMSPNGGASVV